MKIKSSSSLMRMAAVAGLILGLTFGPGLGNAGGPSANIELILDASGSMWGQVEGRAKIQIAKEVLADLIQGLPDKVRVGLMAYGHRVKGDCNDVEQIVALGPLDKAGLTAKIEALSPKGKTPLTLSIKKAMDLLKAEEEESTIILVSDGKETCQGDPCALVKELKAAGLKFVLHVIGFDVSKEERNQLECMAQAGGGRYYPAKNAGEFKLAAKKATQEAVKPKGPALAVGATKNGRPLVVQIKILKGEKVLVSSDNSVNNPEKFQVEPGVYEIQATDTSMDQEPTLSAQVEFKGRDLVHMFDFTQGLLKIKVLVNDQPGFGDIEVFQAGTEERAATSDTSVDNPEKVQLLPGVYDVKVTNSEISADLSLVKSGVALEPGQEKTLTFEFKEGYLSVKVVKNGQPGFGDIEVFQAGTEKRVASSDTSADNPETIKLLPGVYDVKVTNSEVPNDPYLVKSGVALEPGQEKALTFEFKEGYLSVKVVKNGQPAYGGVYVYLAGTEDKADTSDTSADNPVEFKLSPGDYDVVVYLDDKEDKPMKKQGVAVLAGQKTALEFAY
ncbi:MAG: VWA domain-containing protein [Deltaproteobacteria bacterium]|nr:VWA domain-containing protein [Deltaproteobacteria bacterium]